MTAMDKRDDITGGMTARQRLHYRFFHDQAMQFDYDLRHAIWIRHVLPDEWRQEMRSEPVKGKTRVTLRLDEDLVRFFRAFGPGWQTRLNTVVRAYVKARLAGILDEPDGVMSMTRGLSRRPGFGTFERVAQGLDPWGEETDGNGGPAE